MDPDENLRCQLALATRSQKLWDECPDDGIWTKDQQEELANIAISLGHLVESLNDWIIKGGFYPARWRR